MLPIAGEDGRPKDGVPRTVLDSSLLCFVSKVVVVPVVAQAYLSSLQSCQVLHINLVPTLTKQYWHSACCHSDKVSLKEVAQVQITHISTAMKPALTDL